MLRGVERHASRIWGFCTYSLGGREGVESVAPRERVDALPLPRPLRLVCGKGIIHSLRVLASPSNSISNPYEPYRSWRIDVLDILFAVEEQEQETTEERLDSFARRVINDVALELLGAKVGQGFGEGIVESASEHDEELKAC